MHAHITPFVLSRPYKEFKHRSTNISYMDLAMEYALNKAPLNKVQDATKNAYIDRPYKVTKNVVELTLIDPITTDVNLELSIYAYLTKQNLTKGILNFAKKTSSIIKLTFQLMSKDKVETYLANWKTDKCPYEDTFPSRHCTHCGARWICGEERGIDEAKTDNNNLPKRQSRKSRKDTTI